MNDHTNEQSGQEPAFPMRLNKYLAMEGKGSRRDMDEVIRMGRVVVNGRTAKLGDKVNEGDKVEIRFKGLGQRAAENRSGRNDGNNRGAQRGERGPKRGGPRSAFGKKGKRF